MAAAATQSEADQKEAKEYWGYLFKPDRTGTDQLKNLLRGLYNIITSTFEPSGSPDITPTQLAHFYRALNGNYDPLFLMTSPSTIAFIYKNLNCLHSLQPLPHSGQRFSEPVIPALKVEGWITWQTIQLLLGPNEHAEFLRQAVQKWDVKNPDTGETFPKILPRSCFPSHPDSGMVNWYESVSTRLRREAEDQDRARITELEDRPDTPNNNRHHRKISSRYSNDSVLIDDSSPETYAIAYFRNPLFRTVDGRPGVVRSGSRRRPPLSPRDSFVQRGKVVGSTLGKVLKNVGSPHLWDGHSATVKDKDRDRDHRRRRSLPDKHNYQDDPEDDGRYSRRGSAQESPPVHSHHHHRTSSTARPSPTYYDTSTVRHRRSHDPTSSREYFPPFKDDEEENRRHRSATHLHPRSASPVKAGFMPSVSPLFATHVASAGYRTSSRTRPVSQQHSPERTDNTRYSAEGSGSEIGSGNARGARRGAGPKSARFSETPVGGVSGRKYPVEASWR